MKSISYRLAKRCLGEYNEHKAEIIPTMLKTLKKLGHDTNEYESVMLEINNSRLKSALYFYKEYKAQGGKRIIKELEEGEHN